MRRWAGGGGVNINRPIIFHTCRHSGISLNPVLFWMAQDQVRRRLAKSGMTKRQDYHETVNIVPYKGKMDIHDQRN